ncbi:MAG: hypothetical protein FWD62_00235 [Betaproteobacteria bacterium]|nr:hypothetical protein [Betaproteobacteria bacterium]
MDYPALDHSTPGFERRFDMQLRHDGYLLSQLVDQGKISVRDAANEMRKLGMPINGALRELAHMHIRTVS